MSYSLRLKAIRAAVSPVAIAVVNFLKVPANLLSVAAIVATVIVPLVDKFVKSDEEKRTKLTQLTDATNTLISSNEGILQAGPGAANSVQAEHYSIAAAKRQNDLYRAVSIADSILRDAYPSILIALARELCRDNDSPHAKRFTEEVLRRAKSSNDEDRPKIQEAAEAHTVMAGCIAYSAIYADLTDRDRRELDSRMAKALVVLDERHGRAGTIDRIGVELSWMEMDQAIGSAAQADLHLKRANELAKSLNPPDWGVMQRLASFRPVAVDPAPQGARIAPPLPGFQRPNTYDVTFEDSKGVTGTLLVTSGSLYDDGSTGILLIYRNGNLSESLILARTTMTDDQKTLIRLDWTRDLPERSAKVSASRQGAWLVEKDSSRRLEGVHMVLGSPSMRFVANVRDGEK